MENQVRFEEMPLHPDVLDALEAMGFQNATPIQAQGVPAVLAGRDLLGIAQTGTGKTAAFLLPVIDRILDTPENGKVKALIVVPTRELAQQIDQAVEGFGYYANVTSLAIYGGGSGHDFTREKNALVKGADIIIATPGRFLSHLNLGYVDLSELSFLILDEADRMLDMGFVGDIMRIAEHCKKDRQTLLFSATMPDRIEELARELQKDPVTVKLALSKPAEKIKQGHTSSSTTKKTTSSSTSCATATSAAASSSLPASALYPRSSACCARPASPATASLPTLNNTSAKR